MYKRGAKNLSDVELLAIILQHGTIHQNAVDLARSLLNAAQNNVQKFYFLPNEKIIYKIIPTICLVI
jgi:DNA repair protein RadC